ncbi:hypothetical protein BD410DRAFT_263830 [Rickenella mellea]|uniref:Uncharacterized protein n=1 Tax=Rickenella mellea TaxID=50990 RepID=A0A4Y7Q5Q0_9AGAM|nr:hypothetical protein BD410DRAFT_263830 [Rickenella mellea]
MKWNTAMPVDGLRWRKTSCVSVVLSYTEAGFVILILDFVISPQLPSCHKRSSSHPVTVCVCLFFFITTSELLPAYDLT